MAYCIRLFYPQWILGCPCAWICNGIIPRIQSFVCLGIIKLPTLDGPKLRTWSYNPPHDLTPSSLHQTPRANFRRMNKADVLKVIATGNSLSSAIARRLEDYPHGRLAAVKDILENELPTVARQVELACPVEFIRDVVAYAEGYEGCISFPERGVRTLIRNGLAALQDRVLGVVHKVTKLIIQEVQECAKEEFPQRLEGGGDEDFCDLLVRLCTDIVVHWSADATKMVSKLIAMEHELPDIRMLRQLLQVAEATIEQEHAAPPLQDAAPSLERAPSAESMRYIMGYLHKKDRATGGWSQRWCVVQPQTQRLFVHKDPTKPPTYEIDLSRLQLVDGSSRTKSRTFILKPVDPGESALSTKQKSELCFKAPSTHVKDLWIRSLGLLCGTQQSMQMSAAPPEEAKTADCELKIPSILDSNQIKPGLAGESGVLRVDPDFRALSLALGEYLSIVRDHLVVFAVPKAVLHLFVSKVMKNLKDSLVDKLVENF